MYDPSESFEFEQNVDKIRGMVAELSDSKWKKVLEEILNFAEIVREKKQEVNECYDEDTRQEKVDDYTLFKHTFRLVLKEAIAAHKEVVARES